MTNLNLFLVLFSLCFFHSHSFCGNEVCEPYLGETRASCELDCFCGDQICDYSEYWTICPDDCLTSCGDLICANNEVKNCPLDCGEEALFCGNLECDIGETTANCPSDCDTLQSGEDILYVLYVSDSEDPSFLYTCNVTLTDLTGSVLIDQYQMVVVAYGKTVPYPGSYLLNATCDNFMAVSSVISIPAENSGQGGQVFTVQPECVPQCSQRSCGSDSCGGFCGECGFQQECVNGVCLNPCTRNCSGKVCGEDGCGGSCGVCSSGFACSNGSCISACSCANRVCGSPYPDCPLCGLCPYEQYCTPQGTCSKAWSSTYFIATQNSGCPTGIENCLVGPSAFSEVVVRLKSGDQVVVGPGTYCGGFMISTDGVSFIGQPGATIVPCSSQWWDPAPPNCNPVDGNGGTPCSLANSLITINGSNIVISGFQFNGKVPNSLFAGTSGVQVYFADGTAIGAGRALANWIAGPRRTVVTYPVLTVSIKSNNFSYFEESALRFKSSTVSIQSNNFTNVGTIGTSNRRQGKTEKTRGARKDKPGAPVVLDNSSGDVTGNKASNCDYGGLNGGDYPPSVFPFSKRQISSTRQGRQYDYSLTRWSGNQFSNMNFGAVIVESKNQGVANITGNIISGNSIGRGFIVENVTEGSSLLLAQNSIQAVEIGSWTWKAVATFSEEEYQMVQTGIHLISCNPYETEQPLASLNVYATETEVSESATAFWVQDEPASNPLCSTTAPILLELQVEGGLISNSEIGLQTSGNRLNASKVSIFTDNIGLKTSVNANSLGLTASPQTLPPSCPTTCNGHGECAGINICECDNGYHESDCSVEVCGDRYCTFSETTKSCQSDCGPVVRKTSVTMNFGGLIPEASCCSSSS